MQGCVSPPWTPFFAYLEDFLRTVLSKGLANAQIGMWKSVRPGKGAHRDVLRGPFPDAWNFTELPQGFLDPTPRLQEQTTAADFLRQGNQCFGSSSDDPQSTYFINRSAGDSLG